MAQAKNKLPQNAKRVFKGVIFDVWQWRQKMFDGSFATFERLSRPDTVNVIAVVGEKIILLYQKQPDWKKSKNTLVGGRVDGNESPYQAAKRELLEETGYTSKNWTLWKKINPYNKIVWTVHNFIARDCVKIEEPNPDAGEKLKTRLVSFENFLEASEDPDFYEGELKGALLRARYNPKYGKEFKRLLFGK